MKRFETKTIVFAIIYPSILRPIRHLDTTVQNRLIRGISSVLSRSNEMVVRIREIFVFLKLERVSFDELLLGQFTAEFVIG